MARRDTARIMLSASALTVLGAIPPFLLGTQAVLIRRDVGFGPEGLGIAVGVYFAAAAVTTMVGGSLLRRWGFRGSLAAAGGLVAIGGLAMVTLVHSLPALVLVMVVLGAANASCQSTSNAVVATVVPLHRRGLGFGIKQSAVPMAIMLGGLAVPTTTALFGWRSTFAMTGVIGLVILVVALARRPPATDGIPSATSRSRVSTDVDRAPLVPLVLCGIAMVLASAAANFIGAYLASWAHEVGMSVEAAGVLVAVGSGASVLARIGQGHLADGRQGRNLPVVASQMVMGGICLLLIGALPQVWAVVVFGLLAFLAGWSWPGLFLFAVARLGRDSPTHSTTAVQAGAFLGGALGPAVLGGLVASLGFQAAWYAAGGLFLLAGAIILVARQGYAHDLRVRPPA